MPTKSEVSERNTNPINLKHRITGAGVLILFGALILPWMLGPPSEAKKDLNDTAQVVVSERHSTFEDEVLAELQSTDEDFEEPEETVYVSKITPVDGQANAGTPVLVKQNAPAGNESDTASSNSTASKAAEPTADKNAKANEPVSVAKHEAKNSSADIVDKKNSKPKADTKLAKTKPSIVSKRPKIDVGWVVQVELLVDKSGAKKLVENLKLKGFEPQTTVVDTNRGKNTGTRIWLGPFEQRAEAGKENDKLEAKMGKRGFLRVYP